MKDEQISAMFDDNQDDLENIEDKFGYNKRDKEFWQTY